MRPMPPRLSQFLPPMPLLLVRAMQVRRRAMLVRGRQAAFPLGRGRRWAPLGSARAGTERASRRRCGIAHGARRRRTETVHGDGARRRRTERRRVRGAEARSVQVASSRTPSARSTGSTIVSANGSGCAVSGLCELAVSHQMASGVTRRRSGRIGSSSRTPHAGRPGRRTACAGRTTSRS